MSSTPSASGSRPWAGPVPRSAPPRPRTAGRGSWLPRTPSSGSPAPSHKTCGTPGRNRSRPNGSPRPASDGGSETSAPRPLHQPGHQNPHAPDPAAHQDRRTGTPPPAMTWAESSLQASPTSDPPTTRSAPNPDELDKTQGQHVFSIPTSARWHGTDELWDRLGYNAGERRLPLPRCLRTRRGGTAISRDGHPGAGQFSTMSPSPPASLPPSPSPSPPPSPGGWIGSGGQKGRSSR